MVFFTTPETVVPFSMHLKISIHNLYQILIFPSVSRIFFCLYVSCFIQSSNSGLLSCILVDFSRASSSIALNMQLKFKQLVDHLQMRDFMSFTLIFTRRLCVLHSQWCQFTLMFSMSSQLVVSLVVLGTSVRISKKKTFFPFRLKFNVESWLLIRFKLKGLLSLQLQDVKENY